MERIALADKFFELVNNGTKTSTIRYKHRDYKTGECLFYSYTSDLTARVEITDVSYKTFAELTEDDAKQDGFKDLHELKSTLYDIYPNIKLKDEITKVIFKIKC
jgi:hypothetical protein